MYNVDQIDTHITNLNITNLFKNKEIRKKISAAHLKQKFDMIVLLQNFSN